MSPDDGREEEAFTRMHKNYNVVVKCLDKLFDLLIAVIHLVRWGGGLGA